MKPEQIELEHILGWCSASDGHECAYPGIDPDDRITALLKWKNRAVLFEVEGLKGAMWGHLTNSPTAQKAMHFRIKELTKETR